MLLQRFAWRQLPGQAGELIAMEAASLDLGGFHGVVYYTNERDGPLKRVIPGLGCLCRATTAYTIDVEFY